MRELEAGAEIRGVPVSALMENAGKASAIEIEKAYSPITGKRIMVLVGPGNNGGDGLVAARYLSEHRARVNIVLGTSRKEPDSNLERALEKGIPVIEAWRDFQVVEEALAQADIVIDALFGTGKARAIEGLFKQMLEMVKRHKASRPSMKIVALDLPSGMDADTGFVDPSTCPADFTVTMAFPKSGFYSFPGAEYLGKLSIVDIGIPDELAENIKTELLSPEWARANLPHRPLGANKGTFGRVMVVAGSSKYIGAPYLACAAAYRAGAGLVTLASTKKVTEITAGKSAEITYLPLPENEQGFIEKGALEIITRDLKDYKALLIGPGLGREPETSDFLFGLLAESLISNLPMVLDADALNLLSEKEMPTKWWQKFPRVILTPHPGEFSKLTGLKIADIEKDRIEKARGYAKEHNKVLVLKGAFTAIASPDGNIMVSPWANPALATAGTGDVLAGIIAAFLAQDKEPFASAALGVYIHGLAGELIKDELGQAGAIASDLLLKIPLAIKKIRHSTKSGFTTA